MGDRIEDLLTAVRYLCDRNPNNQDLLCQVLNFLKESGKDDAYIQERINEFTKDSMEIVKQQLLYTYTKKNAEQLVKTYSNMRACTALDMLQSFAPDIAQDVILANSDGLMH